MEKALSPIKRFWMLLKPDQMEIRNIYLYAIFIGLLNLSLPLGIQAIINLIQGGQVSTSWFVLIIFVITGIVLAGLMQIAQLRIIENLQQKIFTRAAFEFVYRIPRLRIEKLVNQYAPELMNRFFDIVSIQKGLSKILVDFSSASIQVFFGLILLSVYHPFFIIFSLLLVVTIFAIFRLTAKKGLATSLQESKYKYNVVHWLEELARTNTTFKLAGHTNLPMSRVNERAENYITARESHFNVLLKQYYLMVLFKSMVALGLLLIGGILVIEQQMNIGQFVAAEIIILLVINSVEKLILGFETIYDVLTSLEKVGQVTDLGIEEEGGVTIPKDSKGLSLVLKNVSYTYPEENRFAVNNISIEVKSGEHVLFTGSNDSGKSTLLYLMSGLYDPSHGSVVIDNVPYQNYNKEALRSVIGGYLRDERLFEGTLLENITVGRENATFERVQRAISNLGLLELVSNLPHGYDTKIMPHGRQFSKSTVSKLLIARAIVDQPRLLLLENSFSIFTPEDKNRILNFLLDKTHNWTVLLTSSNKNEMAAFVDRIIVLNNGEIITE